MFYGREVKTRQDRIEREINKPLPDYILLLNDGAVSMKTDLNSIKSELRKLTDLDYLKKELGQITSEIKNFDLRVKVSPQARGRLKQLEKRFQQIRKSMVALQKQVDGEVNKLIKALRKAGFAPKTTKRKATRKKTSSK